MSVFVSLTDSGFYYAKKDCKSVPDFISYDDQESIDVFFGSLSAGTQIEVAIDVVEEELELTQIPKIYPWERNKVLALNERRIKTKRVAFVHSKFVERDKVLFLRFFKIFRNAGMETFLQRCEENRLLIKGIYISELLIEESIGKLKLDKTLRKAFAEDVTLIVMRRSAFTYKQLVFSKGVLELVRTIEIPEDVESIIDTYDYVTRECDMTIKYLYNAKIVEYGKSVNMLFVDREEIKAHEESLAALIDSSLVVKSEWDDEVYTLHFRSFSELLPIRSKHFEITDLVTFTLCLLHKSFMPSSHIATEATSLVRTALAVKGMFTIVSLVFLLAGGYYIGSLASRYLFLVDSSDYISTQNRRLTTIKKDLTEKIKIPYDARDLKALVEFSQKFPQEHERADIRHAVSSIANTLNANPDIKLVKVSIDRQNGAGQLVPPHFKLKAQFVLTHADVLYEKNIHRMQQFADSLRADASFSNVVFRKLPVEIEPNRVQALNEGMLMPVSLPFEIEWEWRVHE